MNNQNFEYLKENLLYTGFGTGLNESLQQRMAAGEPSFQLKFETEINKKAFVAFLNFRKSDNSDMYFFNSYHASLQRSNGEIVDQVFYLNKGKGVTAKEAYNLLEGRAVYKELATKDGQSYRAWIQIDFDKKDKSNNHEMRQFHESYGYNLTEALNKYPIRDMAAPDLKDILIASLQKGNVQAVALEKDGGATRMFVEANPQYKTVTLYDAQFKRVEKEALSQYQTQKVANGQQPVVQEKNAKNQKQTPEGVDSAVKPRNNKKRAINK